MILMVLPIGALFCFMTGSNRLAESARIRGTIPTDVTLEVAQMAHVQVESVARLVRRVPLAILAVGCLSEDVPVPKGVEAIWVSFEIRLVLELVAEQRPVLDKDGSRRNHRRYNLYCWRWACRCCLLIGDRSGLSFGDDLGEELQDRLLEGISLKRSRAWASACCRRSWIRASRRR